MENKKSSKGLVTVLVILMLVFAAGSVLLFTGVIKSPLVKCDDTKETTKEKTDTKTDDDTKKEEKKEDSSTIKSADERYKEYVSKLAEDIKGYYNNSKGQNTALQSYASDSFDVYMEQGFGTYRLKINNNLELVMDVTKPNNESLYQGQKVADNVVAYFVKHLGNGIPSTLFYITTEGKLYSAEIENAIGEGNFDSLEKKELDKKNIVNIEQATFVDAGGEDILFIDIDGNVITE